MISDISIQFCEYNRSNPDADRIYRPQGSGDYLFLLLKTPMKVYQENGILITGENACILYTPGQMQHYQAVQKFRNSYLHFVAQGRIFSASAKPDILSAKSGRNRRNHPQAAAGIHLPRFSYGSNAECTDLPASGHGSPWT